MKASPKQLRIPAALLVIIGVLIFTLAGTAAQQPLNVIVVLVDDLGWMDLSCQGSDFYRTPNIDKLASTGMRFIDGYAACAVCSPTRAALMTGRYPARLGITDWIRAEFQLHVRQWPNVRDVPGFHDGGKALITPVNNLLLPHSRDYPGRARQAARLSQRFHREVAPGREGSSADRPGVRRELRRLGLRSTAILL